MSRLLPPASTTRNPWPEGSCVCACSLSVVSRDERAGTHREHVVGEPVEDARMQARLALRDEADARLARVRARDVAAVHGRAAHLGLLRALPAVRVAEHKLQVVLDHAPHRAVVRVRVDDEAPRAAKEVPEEVAKDMHGALAAREGGQTHAVHLERHRLWPQVQLEPVRRWGVSRAGVRRRTVLP